MKYRVKDDSEMICRFYGDSDSDYVEKCQEEGIPEEDLEFMVNEFGLEVMEMLEEM